VTGGAGFIGRHFVECVLEAESDARVTVLDKLTYAGNPKNLEQFEGDPRYAFVKGDICDSGVVDRLIGDGVDVVVNFAAETHVDRSIGDAGGFIHTDVYGTYVLLEAVRRHGGRFLQVSTDEVYGEVMGEPVTEEGPLLPRNPYAASKCGADRLAYSYFTTHGVPVCISRCSNNYGPFQYPEKLISLFVTNALDDEPLPVYGDGRNVRDWIHVTDHVRALRTLVEESPFEGDVYNVAGRAERSILDIADVIIERLDKPRSILRYVKDRPGHDRRYAIDDSKIRARTSWRPRVEFADGIADAIDWYRDRRDWWEPIKSGEFKTYYRAQYDLGH
jgi:dTDP-glucose 4,6-dehydratase